ncbi:MAG: phospholipid/cholesterol/gamma-HCH transport system substrate-binding protein [Pseudonocardiales bacterium]|jgi:phospholipid/cholesterol/gamma-HCH transport system substrate-binding protein|nr:phospholipid/cholesterol/gamma-HCH transport system substrate-binding protein [Pseudonocardiales bacterium]MDT7627971.1 phospholipid/cholesterol/gamma-HCH transport system substrate-binding protein [Pseudonocardiales bacterium]
MTSKLVKAAVCTLAVALTTTGCEFNGINSYALPGTKGTGSGSYRVDVQLPNAMTLEPNTDVKVGDVTVGTVRSIRVEDWHARVTISLGQDVQLPENSTVKLGETSLLGANYLELAPPVSEPPRGHLRDGDVIPLARSGRYPSTEDVLASLSVLLNGGGLSQLHTVTTELNRAMNTREQPIHLLLPDLNESVHSLETQKAVIVRDIEAMNRLAGTLGRQRDTIGSALENIGPAAASLNEQRPDFIRMLGAFDEFSSVGTRVLNNSRDDMLGTLHGLQPTLNKLADSGDALVDWMFFAFTVPFALRYANQAVQGDYFNMFITFDLTQETLERYFLSGTPLEGIANTPPPAGQATDPLLAPLDLPAPKDRRSGITPAPPVAPESGGLVGGILGGN